jgi:hypothetical protein
LSYGHAGLVWTGLDDAVMLIIKSSPTTSNAFFIGHTSLLNATPKKQLAGVTE